MFIFLGALQMGKNTPPQFLHDSNRRRQVPILKLRAKGGWKAYGLYNGLVEILREQPEFRIALADLGVVAVENGIDPTDLELVVEDACTIDGLLVVDDGFIFDVDLMEKMTAFGAVRERRSVVGKKGADARWRKEASDLPAEALPTHGDAMPQASDPNPIPNVNDGFANQTKTNQTEDPEVGSESLEVPPAKGSPPQHPFAKYFNHHVQELSGGRRPLLQYPHIWLHPWELQDARERWTEAGMDLEEWRAGLRDTNIAMEQKHMERGYKGGKALQYLTTHILTNALEQKKKKLDVKIRTGERPAARRSPSSGQPSPLGDVIGALGIVKAVKS